MTGSEFACVGQTVTVTLNRMRRKFLCGLAASLGAFSLEAQTVPARDLWEFPLGAVLQPAALSTEPAGGLWNPAAHGLGKLERLRIGVTSLSAPSDVGVEAHAIGLVYRSTEGRTFGFSIARTAIAGIVRTESDPQTLGDVPFNSLILSAGAAAEILPKVKLGAALRWREGRADRDVRHALAADLGLVVEELPLRKTRLAVSSFLWRPGREIEDRPSFLAAGDFAVYTNGTNELRAGYSFNGVNRGTREQGPYFQGRVERLEASVASLITRTNTGHRVTRVRSGVALRYAKYLVGVGREESVAGLGPLYQFTLSSIIR